MSALLVTHERTEALGLASRVMILDQEGDVEGATAVQVGSPEDVYARPATRGVAAMTGPYNLITGTGAGHVAETVLGTIPLGRAHTGPCEVVVRPENWHVMPMVVGTDRALLSIQVASADSQDHQDHQDQAVAAVERPQ